MSLSVSLADNTHKTFIPCTDDAEEGHHHLIVIECLIRFFL